MRSTKTTLLVVAIGALAIVACGEETASGPDGRAERGGSALGAGDGGSSVDAGAADADAGGLDAGADGSDASADAGDGGDPADEDIVGAPADESAPDDGDGGAPTCDAVSHVSIDGDGDGGGGGDGDGGDACAPPACSVDSIDIARSGTPADGVHKFDFYVKITVKGKNLKKCDIRQLVMLSEHQTDWDGTTAVSDDVLKKSYAAPLAAALNDDVWATDTGWDWAAFKNDTENKYSDHQLHSRERKKEDKTPTTFRWIAKKNTTSRHFSIEIRDHASGAYVDGKSWWYTWDNDNAKLPHGKYCGSDIANFGQFTGVEGITGLN